MALFPRKVGGRYMALSRWDRERLAVTVSDDGSEWAEATTLRWAPRPWELVQVGNCGSPLETPEGWLVLTHGVGPMRTVRPRCHPPRPRRPRRVLATLPGPLLVANDDEHEEICAKRGVLLRGAPHGEVLVLPYGFSDSAVGFALVDVAELLGSAERLTAVPWSLSACIIRH